MINLVLFAFLLFAQVSDPGEDRINSADHAISVKAAPGWTQQAAGDEPDLAFRLMSGSESAADMFVVRVRPTESDLKSHWTGLRYSVIVDLGGKIVSDKPYNLLGAKARMLVYKAVAPTSGKQRMFIRVYAVRGGKLYVCHAALDPATYATERDEVLRMLESLQLS